MWYYLDKRGQPIEWFKGWRLSNFVRFLLYCRDITTERPDCMYPCWMCENCRYAEADEFREIKDCPKCKAGIMYHVKKKYKNLTPGATQGGSKNPPIRPRPDIKVPAQVSKPKEMVNERIRRIREKSKLLQCQRVAMGLLTDDIDPVEGDKDWSPALEEVKGLRAERDELCAKMHQLCQGIEMGIPEPPDHVCGNPDSMCDCLCVDWANWCQFIAECKKLSSPGNADG